MDKAMMTSLKARVAAGIRTGAQVVEFSDWQNLEAEDAE